MATDLEKLDKKRMVFHFAENEALPFLSFYLLRFENLKSVSHRDVSMHLQSQKHLHPFANARTVFQVVQGRELFDFLQTRYHRLKIGRFLSKNLRN